MGAVEVLLTVANQLAKQAMDSMPKLQEDERIKREWYKNHIYFRETELNGETFLSQYDFKQRTRRREAVEKRGDRQSLT